MIVGGYSLHLYCACADCRSSTVGRRYRGGFQEFGGANRSQAIRSAREAGWRVNYKADMAWAPGHKRSDTDTAEL